MQLVLLFGLCGCCFQLTPIDALEMFSGMEAITKSDLEAGLRAVGFEMLKNKAFDVLTTVGYANAMLSSLCVKPGGKGWGAPVCSSYSWMSRASTRRRTHRPLGATKFLKVQRANTMVSRVVLQLWVWQALGMHWYVEQPQRSIMYAHPRFQQFIEANAICSKIIYLENYEGETQKALKLLSPDENELNKFNHYVRPKKRKQDDDEDRHKLVRVAVVDGKKHVTGDEDALKESQAYPLYFGSVVNEIYMGSEAKFKERAHKLLHEAHAAIYLDAEKVQEILAAKADDMWDDANLEPIFKMLKSTTK